jgi:hypothetical protein
MRKGGAIEKQRQLRQDLQHLPGIGASLEIALEETLVYVKFHDPASRWKWYVIEFDGEDTFFGLVVNPVGVVAGQFKLAELECLRFGDEQEEGEGVERDTRFQPLTVADLAKTEPGIDDFLSEERPLASLQ